MPNFESWKTDSDGAMALVNGNPVAVMDDGTELPFDYVENHAKPLGSANAEAQQRRERIRELERSLEPWNALDMSPDDVQSARRELSKLQKAAKSAANGDGDGADTAKLADLTEQLEQAQAKVDGFQKQIEALTGERDNSLRQVHDLTVGAAIRGSKFFSATEGNQPLSMQHPDVAARDLAVFGEPGEGGSVIWYTDPKEHNAQTMIRGQDGNPATDNEAIAALGPKLGWWSGLLRKKGATGSGAAGGAGVDAISGIASKGADLQDPDVRTKTIAHLKEKHGKDWAAHYQRILTTKE